MAAIRVRARASGDEYDIVIGPGALADLGREVRRISAAQKAAIITDDRVGPLYLQAARHALEGEGFAVIPAQMAAGEDHKNLESLGKVYDDLLRARLERSTPVIALGGGVVGDVAGFAAATLLRGLPLVQAPTSLLAMVDASIGGKTGVNHAEGKNLIGAFHQPALVLADTRTLGSLPPRELRSGLAECIKHDCIRDADGLTDLEANIDKALALDVDYLARLVAHNAAIKAKVVANDPTEQGERAHLNFGHTIGHAIEHACNYALSHGECVALGMVAAARVSTRMGLLDDASARRIVALIGRAGLPIGERLRTDAVLQRLAYDKKVRDGKVRFVLLEAIGRPVIRDDVPIDLVREAVQSLGEG